MKKRSAIVVSLALAAFVVTAAGGQQTVDKLEGTWTATGGISDGKKVPEDLVAKLNLIAVFKDGKYTITIQGKQLEAGTYKIDGSKKPATIDMAVQEGKDKGKSQIGIYKLEGDNLTLVLANAGIKERPKSFDGAPQVEVSVFKRKK
jgi:uncharacterized protein (TIGR03067 family)